MSKPISANQTRKILICYKSKYGSTKQYAQMISDAINVDLIDINKNQNINFSQYDTIIFGGYYHMGKINVAQIIKNNWDVLKNKEVILFTTSGTPPTNSFIKDTYEASFSKDMKKTIKYFPLWGRLGLAKLTFFDKLIMWIGNKLIIKDPLMKKGMETNFDGVKQENLAPLLDFLKKTE